MINEISHQRESEKYIAGFCHGRQTTDQFNANISLLLGADRILKKVEPLAPLDCQSPMLAKASSYLLITCNAIDI